MIHPTALVHASAQLADDVAVGPYAIIDAHVRIGAGTRVGAHVTITGHTTIGRDNQLFPYCSLGAEPQDKKYRGEPTELVIGDRNTVREFCTLNRGTVDDGGVTRMGDDNWIMAYVHVAHDCQVGSHTVFANHATLAGHVHVGDWVTLGGFTGVHQFVHVGAHSFTGISSVITQDVPPFVTVAGNPTAPHGVNSEGLRRRGFSADDIAAIKRAYRRLYRSGLSLEEARREIDAMIPDCPPLGQLADFLAASTRGILR